MGEAQQNRSVPPAPRGPEPAPSRPPGAADLESESRTRTNAPTMSATTVEALHLEEATRAAAFGRIVYNVVYQMPTRPRELSPHLARDVELVLAIALAKRPEDRFASADAFANALAAAAEGALDPQSRAHADRLLRASPWARDPGPAGLAKTTVSHRAALASSRGRD